MILAANFTWDAVSQLTVSGIINGAAYGLLGVGFALILGVSGRFHFAYAFTYTLAAYAVFWFSDRAGVPWWPSAILGILSAVVVGVAIERFIYRPIAARAGATALLSIFVASLGVAIAGQNLISLLFSSGAQQLSDSSPCAADPRGPAAFRWPTSGRWLRPCSCALAALLRFTPRSVPREATPRWLDHRDDPNRIYPGLRPGTRCLGVAAFWYGVKFSVRRTWLAGDPRLVVRSGRHRLASDPPATGL
jgi:hypothetical protein